MSRLAILNPDSLVGLELKKALERRRNLWQDLKLLVLETEDYATISEVAGEAALVQGLSDDTLGGTDLLFVCPGADEEPADLVPRLGAAKTVVFVSPTAEVPDGEPIVAGVNLDTVAAGALLVSPDPGAIALTHLLHPLLSLGLEEAVAVVIQPASARQQAGVDELLDQTRGVLAFAAESPQETFGRRLALNLYPTDPAAPIADTVNAALATDVRLAVERLQAGVFHSVSVSAYVRCEADTAAEAVRKALGEHPFVEVSASAQPPGPAEAAGAGNLLASVRPNPREPGSFWLWGVADNLTVGGAANAMAIAGALLGDSAG